jgi:hypothetical protein
MVLRFKLMVLTVLIAPAVRAQSSPHVDARVAHSRDSLPTIETNVTVTTVPAADTTRIELIVTATNRGTERVTIGVACGPSLDVLVHFADGTDRSALYDSIVPDADFTCAGGPSHYADPGQTKTERILWPIPRGPGVYQLRAALRRGDGLGNLSSSITLSIP